VSSLQKAASTHECEHVSNVPRTGRISATFCNLGGFRFLLSAYGLVNCSAAPSCLEDLVLLPLVRANGLGQAPK
jgi:hypothetical protein